MIVFVIFMFLLFINVICYFMVWFYVFIVSIWIKMVVYDVSDVFGFIVKNRGMYISDRVKSGNSCDR